MKIINLNESQFNKLFEGNGDSIYLDGNDSTKQFSSEVSNQALIDTEDGEDQEWSKPKSSQDIAKSLTPQQWRAVGQRNSTNTI